MNNAQWAEQTHSLMCAPLATDIPPCYICGPHTKSMQTFYGNTPTTHTLPRSLIGLQQKLTSWTQHIFMQERQVIFSRHDVVGSQNYIPGPPLSEICKPLTPNTAGPSFSPSRLLRLATDGREVGGASLKVFEASSCIHTLVPSAVG